MGMQEFEINVLRWAHERGIVIGSDTKSQCLKMVEEVGELVSAVNKHDLDRIEDGIGDVLVTLVLLANMEAMTLSSCATAAWDEIKDRKGEMVNGVFVKEEKKHNKKHL